MKRIFIIIILLILSTQNTRAQSGISLPGTCTVGDRFTYSATTPPVLVTCISTNVWAASTLLNTEDVLTDTLSNNALSTKHGLLPKLSGNASDVLHGDGTWGPASGGGIPTGTIIFIDTGTCPAGFAEVSGLNGRMWRGTVAANGDVGTIGGADSITPTVNSLTAAAQTFTGNQLGTHLHGFGTIAVAAHTVVATKQGTSAGNVVTTATHSVSGSTAAITAGTPTGTNGTSVVTGTLNSFDNRSAYIQLIGCKKS